MIIANFFIFPVSCFQIYDESAKESPCLCPDSVCLCEAQENYNDDVPHSKKMYLHFFQIRYSISVLGFEQNKRALGPATNLLRLGNYRIDYSQVDPQLRKLLVAKKKQNSNSFYNLLRYLVLTVVIINISSPVK